MNNRKEKKKEGRINDKRERKKSPLFTQRSGTAFRLNSPKGRKRRGRGIQSFANGMGKKDFSRMFGGREKKTRFPFLKKKNAILDFPEH